VRNSIARALGWALRPALLWLLIRVLPASGRHRRPQRPKRRATTPCTPPTRGNAPKTTRPAPRIPAQRSPYSRDLVTLLPVDGLPLARPYLPPLSPAPRRAEATARPPALRVHPYWIARERAAQRRRRRVLWLATVGVDLDTRNIHAHHMRAAAVGGAR
jgi:hypothetical protein